MAHRSGRRGERPRNQAAKDARPRRGRGGRMRQRRKLLRQVARLRTIGIGALLVGMVLAFAIVLAFQAHNQQQADSSGWVRLASTAPGDVLSAARATATYQSVASADTPLGQALQAGTLGTPVRVHAYRPTPGMLDVWVIPVLEQSVPGLSGPGPHVVALLDFAYDAANDRIRAASFAGPFVPGDPEFGKPFPQMAAPDAQALVAHAGLAPATSATPPELVYFPVNLDKVIGPHPTTTWTGGGQFPDLAVWRVAGAQGADYMVGLDRHVYTSAQLPLQSSSAGQ